MKIVMSVGCQSLGLEEAVPHVQRIDQICLRLCVAGPSINVGFWNTGDVDGAKINSDAPTFK